VDRSISPFRATGTLRLPSRMSGTGRTVKVDANILPFADLSGRYQVRHRLHWEPVHGALQIPRAIFHIDPLILDSLEHERPVRGRGEDAPLHPVQFDIKGFSQLLAPERMEANDLVQTVDDSGVNFRRTAPRPLRSILPFRASSSMPDRDLHRRSQALNPSVGVISALISDAPDWWS
jgi:hypothetical protein